ncbi:MAG TPA: hypothetical protein VLG13_01095 [Patescibacteria group bacterium]|nr:hypothetical protein [Patescibacteria group bacterium]
MSNLEYSLSGTHDIIDAHDMAMAKTQTRLSLESRFQDECNMFRADVFGKLAIHDAMKNGMGWAVFNADSFDEGSLAMGDGDRQILVISYLLNNIPRRIYNRPVPLVRLIANEIIMGEEGNYGMLTTDFGLDGEDDAQYFIDSISTHDSEGMVGVPEIEILIPGQNETEAAPSPVQSLSPVIVIDEFEQIRIGNSQGSFAPGGNVVQEFAPFDTENGCLPFGHFSCFEDKIQALAIGRELLGSILDLEPAYCGTF